MKKIRIGIIGLGNMGMNHLRVYINMSSVDVVALCDINNDNLNNAAKFCKNATLYVDYAQMLANESLDAVSIVVPTKFHKEIALAAIELKKHILLEKPIAQNSEEAKEIAISAKQNNVKCLIGHIERFNPAVLALKNKINEQIIGTIYSVSITRIGTFPISFVDTGVIKELAIHDIDILNYLFESGVKEISAVTKKNICTPSHDILFCNLELENGVIVNLNVNWVSPIKKRELLITGKNGLLHLDYINQQLSCYRCSSKTEPYTKDVLFKRKEGEVIIFEIEKKEPLAVEIEHFINCIVNDQEPFVSAENGLDALKVAQRISEVAEKGGIKKNNH